MTRIAQTQLAIRERHPIGPRETNDMPSYASPDIPIWRSAKAGGRTSLLTKGEVNAYAEIEYVQAHLEEMEVVKNTARYAVKSFNREFPPLPNGDPDLSNASPEDLHTYLGLLTTAYEAIEAYIHWLRIIIGAESAVVDGKINLDEIYASERKSRRWRFLAKFHVTRFAIEGAHDFHQVPRAQGLIRNQGSRLMPEDFPRNLSTGR